MPGPDRFARLVGAVVRRPLLVLAAVATLAAAFTVIALVKLQPSTSVETLVDKSGSSFQATERYRELFGGDTVLILVKGELRKIVETSDLGRVLQLEGCMAGNIPKKGLAGLPKVCTELESFHPAKVVYGPGTFINTAAGELLKGLQQQKGAAEQRANLAAADARKLASKQGLSKKRQDELANSARSLVFAQFTRDILQLALKYGFSGLPALDNPDFVDNLVFDSSKGTCTPKPRFAYLFPTCGGALIQVRLDPKLSDGERARALGLIRRAAAEPRFKPKNGARYVVTGVPVVAGALADEVQRATVILLVAALLIMAATLALVFRARMRLLPLALALGAAGLTFGALTIGGGSLTMASIAALPILIGLAVDYAIQFHARFTEQGGGAPPETRAVRAAALGGPTIATAGLATAVGFLVLLLSPVPMVRGFGVALVLGIVFALACAVTAGFAALVRWHDGTPGAPLTLPRVRAVGTRIAESAPAGRVISMAAAGARRSLGFALRRPGRVLAIALVAGAAGWAADTQTEVISDVRELVPRDLAALRDINQLQETTNVSGEIDVMVSADDITSPEVMSWIVDFQKGALCSAGYETTRNCEEGAAPKRKGPPELYPALSLPDLFRSTDVDNQKEVQGLLNAVPPYFSQAVITRDRKTANLAFGIRLMSLERQKEVIDQLRARLNPPDGVQARLAGLPVLAAEANDELSSTPRRALTLFAGLVLVFLVLLAIRRKFELAAVPLIPIALATGWSALLLFLLRIPLNPMSAALGALVIAISTEFSVLLSARYRQEREAGASPRRALERTYASTGAAVLASGTTAIMGFAALIASDIRMLRDFGIVTVVDLTVSLLGVMIVLPAALLWAEQRGPLKLRLPRRTAERAPAGG